MSAYDEALTAYRTGGLTAAVTGQGRPIIAINWAGNPIHPNDRNRSLATERVETWLSLAHIAWISVQKDRGTSAESWVQQSALLDLGREITAGCATGSIRLGIPR